MRFKSNFLPFIALLPLLFTGLTASATKTTQVDQCLKWLRASVSAPFRPNAPIRNQSIAVRGNDVEVASKWLWRENEKNKAFAAGFNFASPELVDFIISIADWQSLTNDELRGLLRVKNAFAIRELFEDDNTPFAECLAETGATPQDLALWQIHLPERLIPD